ncbi:hypothetical protein GGF37_001336 [Kickxella alabastrina]|nr:hypothetical protein GGF37_001336 [Kickxella alabastrina]
MTSIRAVCASMCATIVTHCGQDYTGIVDTDAKIFETTEAAETFESAVALLHRRHMRYSLYQAPSDAKPGLLGMQAAQLSAENKLLDSQAFEIAAAHSATTSVLTKTNCAFFKLRFDHAIQSTSRPVTEAKLAEMEHKNAALHATICNLQHGHAESRAACAQETKARFAAETARAEAETAYAAAERALVCESAHLAAIFALKVESIACAVAESKLTEAFDFVESSCARFDFICAEVGVQRGKVGMAHAKINNLQAQVDKAITKKQYARDQLTMSIATHGLMQCRLRTLYAKNSTAHCKLDSAYDLAVSMGNQLSWTRAKVRAPLQPKVAQAESIAADKPPGTANANVALTSDTSTETETEVETEVELSSANFLRKEFKLNSAEGIIALAKANNRLRVSADKSYRLMEERDEALDTVDDLCDKINDLRDELDDLYCARASANIEANRRFNKMKALREKTQSLLAEHRTSGRRSDGNSA